MTDFDTNGNGSGGDYSHRDKETLRRLYHDEGLTAEQAAEKCGCSKWTIYRWLKRHDIETRPSGRKPISELHDRDHLYSLYVEDGLSTTEIAEQYDCCNATVSRWLEKHGIEARDFGSTAPEELQDEETLRTLYVERELTSTEIAEMLECGDSTVCVWLHHHDIEIRPRGLPGEKNPMWDPEATDRIEYGRGWNESKREQVRERDNRECQGCGVPESELPRKLSVHHIRPARAFDDPEERNHPDNLISLCWSCHGTANSMSPLLPDFVR